MQLLHRGSLCNRLLPIVERGFKHASNDVKIAAFDAWQALVDNFALNPGSSRQFGSVVETCVGNLMWELPRVWG